MAKFTTGVEGRIGSVIQIKLIIPKALKKECNVEGAIKREKGNTRELNKHLRSMGPLFTETTMDLDTVREGQHTDAPSSCLYVSNLSSGYVW